MRLIILIPAYNEEETIASVLTGIPAAFTGVDRVISLVVDDGSLDLIIACEVMEHLEDPGAYACLFAQKLKARGRLIMSGPTESGVYKLGRILAGYHKYHDYHHHNVYQLHEIITQNGFKIIIQKPYPWKMKPLYMVNLYLIDY
jgi:predicted TPR repeat methyltransferase